MVIAVNARLLLPDKLEGIGRFANETLKIITRNHPEHRFIFIFDRPYANEFLFAPNITPVVCFPPARHPLLWFLFFECSIPRILRKYNADLFISPDGWLSLNTRVKSLPVVHDLNFFHLPEFIPWLVRKYYHYFFPRFIRKAGRIATVSAFSKADMVDLFRVNPMRIDIVYNGASSRFKPITGEEQAAVRKKFAEGCPYFLHIGLIHPRKNLANLIKAFDRFKMAVNSNMKLLVVGSRKWWTPDMQQALEHSLFKDDVIFAGRVTDSDLTGITASAMALVYASYFEGFGIPVLEAMYCDTPVIASGVSSIPEVGGDAVMYVDPASVESISDAMLSLYSKEDIRKELVARGREQRLKFSWERSADLLWKSIEKCLYPLN